MEEQHSHSQGSNESRSFSTDWIDAQEDLDIENAASFSDAIGFMVNGENIVSFTPKKVYYHKM